MEKITLYQQILIDRIIVIYIINPILVIFFAVLAYQILKRRKQRLNLIFSGFFFCMIIGFSFNMSYATINHIYYADLIKILHLLSWFFVFFGTVFILIVHMIILESTLIYSINRQNRYILLYGFLLLTGMLIQVLIGSPLVGINLTGEGRPGWTLIFFIYVILITSGFSIIPIIITSFKIYHRFETKALKRKWFYYLIGSLGLIIFNLYPIQILNLLTGIMPYAGFLETLRVVVAASGVSVVLWVSLMYYGIGYKLKE